MNNYTFCIQYHLKWILSVVLRFTLPNNCFSQSISLDSSNHIKVEKVFYDSNANILSPNDSLKAKFYRVINYKDGIINGPVSDYYISGRPYMTGYYKNGIISQGNENGTFTYYFEDGKVFQVRNYIDGLLDGVFIEYYPIGVKKASVSFSKGERYGCEYSWDENGKLTHKAFIENNQALNRTICDTITGENDSHTLNNTPSYNGGYGNEFPGGEFSVIGNSIYYKTNGLKVISISMVNDNETIISPSSIKIGQHFYVRIVVSGLKLKKDKYRYILAQRQDDLKDVSYGGTGNVNDEGKLDPLMVQLGGGISSLPNYVTSKQFYFSFKVVDRNSDGYLHGFLKFTVSK